MTTRKPAQKKPTPIKAPEPIVFPTPKTAVTQDVTQAIPHPEPATQRLSLVDDIPYSRAEVRTMIHEAIHDYDERQAHAWYKAVMDWPIAEIMMMGEAEFMARRRSILEDGEA